MKRLIDRLKPEILEVIEAEEKEFPTTIGNLKRELRYHESPIQLSIEHATRLHSIVHAGSFRLDEYYDLFEEIED
jgi:hypothetical protein